MGVKTREQGKDHGSDSSSRRPRGKGLRAFLTPGWLISAVLIVAFSYAAITMLAPWQLNKDADITSRNHQIQEGFSNEVVPYSELVDADGTVADDNEWYRVSLTGHYLPGDEVLLRLRPVADNPAYQSLVPFQLDGGRVVLVNRGYMPSKGNVVPEMQAAPSGDVTVVGFLRKNERVPGSAPMSDAGYQQVYGINTGQIGELTGLDLGEDYVQLAEGEPGVLTPMPIPQLDRGSHLSYGFQWIAFGIMAPLGLGYFIWAELRERRRDRAERAEMSATTVTEATPAEETPTVSQVRRRSRYGDQHPDHYSHFNKRHEERF
ncbi:SURF1 family protein [Corynebacterium pacaense]|uniref:SURF1 family cytochrome oxidase biogenesis protein n=1 Tax=Corynebacterium pacaense TaxID=1816684 RepID=UPI0009BB7C7F|nr:SURF1 family protein [Corynebacterium pacaense]